METLGEVEQSILGVTSHGVRITIDESPAALMWQNFTQFYHCSIVEHMCLIW